MTSLRHIYENELGVTCFDRYFQYLISVHDQMPPSLARFSLDSEHYALNSRTTLHDAWLRKFEVRKIYSEAGETSEAVEICLMHSSHERDIHLRYADVRDVAFHLKPDRWPDKPVDLLVHEFCVVEPGVFRHFLQFDRGVFIEIFFEGFDVSFTPPEGEERVKILNTTKRKKV